MKLLRSSSAARSAVTIAVAGATLAAPAYAADPERTAFDARPTGAADPVPGKATRQLKRALGEQGLVVARAYSERPPRFVYELTASGRELAGALRLLADWGARSAGDNEPLRHARCGASLEARWWCPDCEQVVDDAGEGDVVHV